MAKYKQEQARGTPTKGPFFRRIPARFVKRCVKRMLPGNTRGREALSRLKCYNGYPEQLQKEAVTEVPGAHVSKMNAKYMSVGEICKILGGKCQ